MTDTTTLSETETPPVYSAYVGTRADGSKVARTGTPSETFASVVTYADAASFFAAVNDIQAASLLPPADLPSVQAARSVRIRAACAAAITGGFTSAALGQAHLYGSQETDQLNLGGAMVAAAMGGASFTATVICSADSGTTWAAVAHTAAQIATLFGDLRAWVTAQQAKNLALQGQIADATTAAAVDAIVWA